MPEQTLNPDMLLRLRVLKSVVANTTIKNKLDEAFIASNGDFTATKETLRKANVPVEEVNKIDFAHNLAVLTGDNEKLVSTISALPHVSSIREFALTHNTDAIAQLVTDESVPETIEGATVEEKKKNYAAVIQNKLFVTETSAVLQRMATAAELPIADETVRNGVATFFAKNPEFNIRTTSVYNAVENPDAFKGISVTQHEGVINQLKTLQRVQAISTTPTAVAHLIDANLTTAYHVSEMTEKDFTKTFSAKMGETEAKAVYTNATNVKIRNEQALMAMHEFLNHPNIAAIDLSPAKDERLRIAQKKSDDLKLHVNWENLFGTVDFCECGECNSVYSPAAYFVELLQYLRNNNLDPDLPAGSPLIKKADPKDISNTPLEKLFRRRPDLGCLELTCVNTNTVLPYIDLVNEVMESFVVHLKEYHTSTLYPKQADIDPWNVEDETTGELLAQPQHTNYDAYCILKNAVYPFTLPYHQPIDAIRIFLKYLETSRYELMDTFRSSGLSENKIEGLPEDASTPALIPDTDAGELITLNNKALDKAIDAEYLEITREEFIILTKQAFWEKRYYELKCKRGFTEEEYRDKIGVKKVYEYYGYGDEADMLSIDETDPIGLTFVKDQFLKRTGLLYVDLIELLKTQFINPNFPQGKALIILESIRFSYRFLQTLVDTTSSDPKIRFGKLVDFLKKTQPFLPLLDAMLHPDPCKSAIVDWCVQTKDLEKWICCYFEKVGKLIVLTSAEHCSCIEGHFFIDTSQEIVPVFFSDVENPMDRGKLRLNSDCDLVFTSSQGDGSFVIGHVNKADGKISGGMFRGQNVDFKRNDLHFAGNNGETGDLKEGKLLDANKKPFASVCITKDNCNLNEVRLKHLDGTDVTLEEYDKMQRFIRLWRKLEWTIDETDKSIAGLAAYKTEGDIELPTTDDCTHCFDEFGNECECADGDEDCGCTSANEAMIHYDITPDFLHQLVAVKKLLDSTGIELIKLLTFWTTISTNGEKSLYQRLFLTHNLLGIDKVFQADNNGNYLTKTAKITDHIPVLMAAFNLTSADITTIIEFKQIPDELTIDNITILYRHSLLMRVLHVKSDQLKEIVALFANPFISADATNDFIDLWGKMEDAGFTFQQLNYIIRGKDDEKNPLSANKKTILQLAKTLCDGLNAIDTANPDLKDDEEATTELVRAKTSLLFEQTVVEETIALLEGTTIYSTNAPKNLVTKAEDFTSKLSDDLKNRIKYNFEEGSIQVTGILTSAESTEAKALFNSTWGDTIDRVEKQKNIFYNDVLYAIFSAPAAGIPDIAKETLLKGDINHTNGQVDSSYSVENTAPLKRAYFMKAFLPFLRERLTQQFLVETISGATGMDKEVTNVLMSEVLVGGTPTRAIIEIFKSIKTQPQSGVIGWKGYVFPTAEDNYTFAVTSDTQPVPLKLDGQDLILKQQDDPNNVWLSDPIKLKSSKAYLFEVTGLSADLKELSWKTPISPKAAIPASILLPDYSHKSVEDAFIKLQKSAFLINGFTLKADEISYLQKHGSDFDALDFNAISLNIWKRLEAYARLRNTLPRTDTNLIEFFNWTNRSTNGNALNEKISTLTLWKKEDIDKLIMVDHFNLNHKEDFRNEKSLVKLQKALYVADKISMDINLLFDWAKPVSKFWVCHDIAESIRKSIRARYKQEDWELVVKPLNDQLRENQKNALISYLLVQQDLIDWGVVDADSLFEFFLIDVQMDACMETSRIKQAISSVQLYVQRCFLGLEDQYGVPSDVLDRGRWEWMGRNVIWQANRKVFLYPENWIEEDLRDDKSSFYKELESELLQKDINKQNVEDALKSYLYKVDEVANMEVIGLCIAGDKGINGTWNKDSRLHVFGRTRNAPYFFYYRYLALDEMNWYPWENIQVDIPSYNVEKVMVNKVITDNGCYLTPVVFNNRLLIFFPQFMKKNKPNPTAGTEFNNLGKDPNGIDKAKPIEYWEIKMAWSEYRNGKWTQKQISNMAADTSWTTVLPSIEKFKLITNITTDKKLLIQLEDETDTDLKVFQFEFNGSQIQFSGGGVLPPLTGVMMPKYFQKSDDKALVFKPLVIENDKWILGSIEHDDSIVASTFKSPVSVDFYHPFTHDLVGKINLGQLDNVFHYNLDIPDTGKDDAFGGYDDDNNPATRNSYHELKKPYSLYNWELFFHTPVTLADKLSKSQQFEEATKWFHYVFNPLANGIEANRAWQFYPFLQTNKDNFLETFFNDLKANQPNDKINEWRDKPFRPHVIARSRPSAYMKWVVMKYIDNLLAWGDYLFRQDTIESINYATQLYLLAGHILGPRPQLIPKRGKIKSQTYKSLLDKWDAFGNAMVELELIFPFSSQTSSPVGNSNGVIGTPNIFGFASSLYFCIPNNPKLMGYWDTVADRLYKIRHCENIEGVFRKLALWDPPIDPALLVAATAQGLSLDSVLNDLNTPMPNYRFYYLIQKALELCNELKSAGGSLLSVFEKKDAEALSIIRARQEVEMQNLILEVKKLQVDESNKSLEGLLQNRKTHVYRLQHYLKLIGEDLNKVPSADAEYAEINNQIETPIDDSGLKLIAYEKEEIDKASDANSWQEHVGQLETLASILHLIPHISIDGKPLGVGGGLAFGGQELGIASEAVAKGLQIHVSNLSFQSSNAQKKSGFLRQLQDRVFQANLAGYETKQIDRQITSQQIRIQIANQDITNQQKLIDNANEVEEYLKNKYTNEELYSYMEGSIKTLYHQAYTLAYDLAKKAEKVFRFERGLSSSNFIQFGYWDASRDGLLAGERLYIGIKQLEAAYQEKRGYDFEVTKHISLRQVNPLALLELKEKGKCEFELPEVLFDMDYPGHYMRRIKSVSLSIPCIAGPYTSINATLRLLENKFRVSSIIKNDKDYAERTEETDERFTTVNIPITSIAASSGQNDGGVFELTFKDERYMPFEGAGTVSKWRLEFPEQFRQFDYDTITDAIIHMRYTSVEGGDKLKGSASAWLKNYINSVEELSQREGIFAIFDLKHDFANEWYKAIQLPAGSTGRVMQLGNLLDRLPAFTKTFKATNIKAKDIYIAASSSVKSADLTINNKGTALDPFGGNIKINETTNLFHLSDQDETMENWSVKFANDIVEPEKMLMIIRYVLG